MMVEETSRSHAGQIFSKFADDKMRENNNLHASTEPEADLQSTLSNLTAKLKIKASMNASRRRKFLDQESNRMNSQIMSQKFPSPTRDDTFDRGGIKTTQP